MLFSAGRQSRAVPPSAPPRWPPLAGPVTCGNSEMSTHANDSLLRLNLPIAAPSQRLLNCRLRERDLLSGAEIPKTDFLTCIKVGGGRRQSSSSASGDGRASGRFG